MLSASATGRQLNACAAAAVARSGQVAVSQYKGCSMQRAVL